MATADDIPPIPTPTSKQAATAVTPVEAAPVAPSPPPGQGYAAPGNPPPPVYATPVSTPGPPRGLSVASLVCGIAGVFLSLFSFGFLPSLAAVITGHIAQRRQKDARSLWLAGLITGWVGIAISLAWGVFWAIFIVLVIVHGVNGGSGSYGYHNT